MKVFVVQFEAGYEGYEDPVAAFDTRFAAEEYIALHADRVRYRGDKWHIHELDLGHPAD